MASTPWAILLCKFNNDASEPISRQHYEKLFTRAGINSLNMVDFFSDASHGQLDLSGSQVFGWLTLDHAASDYTGSGANPAGRQQLIDWAKQAATRQRIDLTPFYNVVVCMNVPTDLFGGGLGVVCDTSNAWPSSLGQEMGHGYGLDHSRAEGSDDDYRDPWDIMSTQNAYSSSHPVYTSIGPGLNAANMVSRGWLDESRVWHGGGTVDLRPLHRRDLPGNLAVQINGLFVEYRAKERWDAAIPDPVVLVHRFANNHSYVLPDTQGNLGLLQGARLEYGDLSLVNGSWTSVDVLSIDENNKTAQVQVKSFAHGQRDHYAAIWSQSEGAPWRAVHGLTGQQYQQTFDQLVGQGYRLVCVSGYNGNGQALYAAIFEQGEAPLWQARHGLTTAQYQQTFDQLVSQGYRLQRVSGYEANL